ncbi:MAG: AAA family ATPase [bacterium]|nr:AAA family ATPase [bacterium]
MSSSNSEPGFRPQEIQQLLKNSVDAFAEPQLAGTKEEPPVNKKPVDPTNFTITPLELEHHLNQFVIGQADAVSILATKIATHYNRMRLESQRPELPHILGNIKPNVVLIGPTGVGKTYIIRLIADFIHVPFVKADATKFSETGYVGGDVEDLVRELVHVAGGDIAAAERGIIYIDEIDKIAAASNTMGIDVSRTGVQRNLLKIMEETEVDMKVPHDIASQMEAAMQMQRTGKAEQKKVNTRNVLFIVSGAFQQLEEIVRKRMKGSTVGFGKNLHRVGSDDNWTENIVAQDLVSFGFETEFVGRLPVMAKLIKLGVDELYQILRSPTSAVVLGKKRDFLAYGINLEFTDDAFHLLAELAFAERTGARGILAVLERLLLPFEKYLPGKVTELLFDEEAITNPNNALERILTHSSVLAYQRKMLFDHSLTLRFGAEAEHWLLEKSRTSGIAVENILTELLKNYPYGLTLLGKSEIDITVEILQNSQRFLDETIRTTFAKREEQIEGNE